jgi:hypothetical protein
MHGYHLNKLHKILIIKHIIYLHNFIQKIIILLLLNHNYLLWKNHYGEEKKVKIEKI